MYKITRNKSLSEMSSYNDTMMFDESHIDGGWCFSDVAKCVSNAESFSSHVLEQLYHTGIRGMYPVSRSQAIFPNDMYNISDILGSEGFSSLHDDSYGFSKGGTLMDKKISSMKYLNKVTRTGFITGIPLVDSAKKIKHLAKNHFGIERTILIVDFPRCTIDEFYNWLTRYCSAVGKQLKELRRVGNNDPLLFNSSFFIKFDDFTFGIVRVGAAWRASIDDADALKYTEYQQIRDSDVYIYIFGKSAYKYFGEMHNILSKENRSNVYVYNVKANDSSNNRYADFACLSTRKDLQYRSMSTIFMDGNVVENVISHIDNYLDSRSTYSGRGIIYKTGILLYGEPGTGKTSLISAIASKYNMDLVKIDMTSFEHLDIDALTQTLDVDRNKYIIALEDIDCIIANREDQSIDKDDKKTVNKLLQFLDSTSSPNDVIFIATTNHVELLDDALKREARFDLKIHVRGIGINKAIDMCRSFNLTDEQIATVFDRIKSEGIDIRSTPVRQAKLQKMIFECLSVNVVEEETLDGEN